MQNVNTQPIEAYDGRSGEMLDVHSIFFTLQGEGPLTGRAAVFLRLAGCNLRCPLCDTEYTAGRQRLLVKEIVSRILFEWSGGTLSKGLLVVITGGEPMRQNLDSLIKELIEINATVQIESNGVLAPSPYVMELIREGLVYYIVSPKTSRIASETRYATAFKYVISAVSVHDDGLPTKTLGHAATPHVARPPNDYTGPIYVNPADEQDLIANNANMLVARNAAMRFGYVMGIQLHKLLKIE